MKDYAIITARTSSSRLNGKILKNIKNNKKSIDILIERAKKLDLPIVLATSNSKSDLALINYVKNKYKIGIFKGDLNNTIKRWYKCMKKYKIKNACLIDGDDLAFDYKSYSKALKLIKRCGNNEALILKDNKKIITGVFTKVINLKAMKILNDIFNNKIVDTINWDRIKKKIRIKIYKNDIFFNSKKIRLTLDYKEDLIFFRKLYSKFKIDTNTKILIKFLLKKKEITNINYFREKSWKLNQKLQIRNN